MSPLRTAASFAARIVTVAAALAAASPLAGRASASVEVGQLVQDVELATLAGGNATLLGKQVKANVFIFFRPNQEHSLQALRDVARCEQELADRPVYWVAIVSDSFPAADVQKVVDETGIRAQVLVDRGDGLYSRMGIKLHPSVGIADADHKLFAYHPFEKINFCDSILARIRFLLGDITQAQLDAVLSPPTATMPGSDVKAVAMRAVKFGRKQLEMGSHDKALASADSAIAKAPDLAAAHAFKGDVLAAQGKCAEALPVFEQALKLDPADAAAVAGKQRCGAK